MHVLHRPHLHRAIAVTLITALLSIVLTLAIASGLNDHGSVPGPATASGPAVAVQVSLAPPGPSTSPFRRSPFSNLLTAPVTQPWARSR